MTDQDRACNIYREGNRLTFHASGPDRDPAYMVVCATPWRIEGDALVIPDALCDGRLILLKASETALAARCGYFGMSVFYQFEAKPKAPKRGRKETPWKGPKS